MIKRSGQLFILLFLLFALPCSSLALTKIEQKFLDSFPASISGWDKGETADFEKEEPGLGVGIGYSTDVATATLYVYNKGHKTIPAGIGSKAIKAEFAGCKSDIYELEKMGLYKNVSVIDEGKMKLGYGRKLDFMYSKLELTRNDIVYSSWLFLTSYKNHYFKVRMTYPKGGLTDEEVRTFMNNVTDLVYVL